jgi:PleD family two-component response regulator
MCRAVSDTSLSIGSARIALADRAPALGHLYECADKSLYQAKAGGRARVCDALAEGTPA